MISAIIILSLLSLLVATEPEHAGSSTPASPEPLRPAQKKPGVGSAPAKAGQLAA